MRQKNGTSSDHTAAFNKQETKREVTGKVGTGKSRSGRMAQQEAEPGRTDTGKAVAVGSKTWAQIRNTSGQFNIGA